MQTFLPYPDFRKSFMCLDTKRHGKQRVEALQIYNTLTGISSGWKHHPAVLMWKSYEDALAPYHNLCIEIWLLKGYDSTMLYLPVKEPFRYPYWLGDLAFHAAHRSNLLRKDFEFYSKYNWIEDASLPYIWP